MRFIWPLNSRIISRDFYYKGSLYIGGQHMAIDLPAASGTPVKATAAGKVLAAGFSDINGNYVEIRHAAGWRTKYRHLVELALVGIGAEVSQGQVIGKVGSTGWSTGPHLHFDLWNTNRQSSEAVYKVGVWAHDPELYLGQEDDDMNVEEMKALIAEHERRVAHYSFQQIADNLPDLNQHLRNIVKRLIAAGGGGLTAEQVRAIADEEDKKLEVTKR
jgi:murein DD-endopeptidase MepM/ murein hydrolase activator NlpD